MVQTEVGRFVPTVRTVEDVTIDEASFVVTAHLVGGLRAAAGAFLQYFVLESALGGDDPFALAIVCQENGSLRYGLLGLLGLLRSEVVVEQFLRLAGCHQGGLPIDDFGDALREVADVESLNVHALELLADAKAQSVTDFVHSFLGTFIMIIIIFACKDTENKWNVVSFKDF